MGFVKATTTANAGDLGSTSDVTTRTNASAYISTIDAAISIVSTRREVLVRSQTDWTVLLPTLEI